MYILCLDMDYGDTYEARTAGVAAVSSTNLTEHHMSC